MGTVPVPDKETDVPLMLTLVTRQDCHLCEDMERVVRAVALDLPCGLELRDVDSDPELLRQYGESVPVLLVNGRKAFKYRVSPAALRQRLAAEG